jgi:hypothetical protein
MRPFLRVCLALLIVVLAVGSAISYWVFIRPQLTGQSVQFTLSLYPQFFHVAAGGGKNVTVFVQRSPGFSGAVKIELVNLPSWAIYMPLTLNATDTNGTFAVGASQNAPLTELNLTVRASSAGAADQVATLDMKVVGVSTVTSTLGSGVVYDTTKVLDANTLKALSSYQNGTLVFSAMTPQLQDLTRGDVIVVPPSTTSLANGGLWRLVLSTTTQGGEFVLQTIQATLFDEFQELDIGAGHVNATASQLAASSPLGPSQIGDNAVLQTSKPSDQVIYDQFITLFDLKNIGIPERNIGGDVTFSGKGDFVVKLGPAIHIGVKYKVVPVLSFFKMHVIFGEDITLALKGSAGSQLKWDEDVQTLAEGTIPLLGPVLTFSYSLTLAGTARGPLTQNIDGYWYQSYSVELGPTWDDHHGWSYYQHSTGPTVNKNFAISLGSGTDAKIGVGPKLQAGLNANLLIVSGAANGWIAAYFTIVLQSQIPKPPDKTSSWWVMWEIDGIFGVSLSFTVGISKISKTWSLEYCIPSDCNPGRILGPYSLFDGWPLPPLVKISFPDDGDTLDYNTLLFLPAFTATALGEDGDQCSGPRDHLVWSDEYGQIGTGCTLPSVKLKPDGIHHVTFTATDSAGASASTTVTVIVNVAKPDVYITEPHNNDTFMVGQTVTLVGYGITNVNYYPCNQASGSLVWFFTISEITSQPQSGTNYCTATTTFDKPGVHLIRLVAKDSSSNLVGFSKLVKINVIAPSQTTNYPPIVEITSPTDGQSILFSNVQISLEGNVYDPEGDPMGSYTWSYTPVLFSFWNFKGPKPSPVTIATGALPSLCTANSPCGAKATLNAADYCKVYPLGGLVALELAATETGPIEQTGKSGQILIHLYCQKPVAIITPPIFSLTASHSEGILNDRRLTFAVRSQRRFCDGRSTGPI